jgi:TatD DNase family protein
MFFDTHAHYDSSKFNSDRDEVLSAMPESGVTLIVDPGDNTERSRRAVALAHQYPFVYAAVGWHPEEAEDWTDESLNEIRALADDEKVVAIGEIGLDYYWPENPVHDWQNEVFRRQLALAEKLDMPVIVHDRDAHGDCLAAISEFPNVRGVFHCYSGSPEMAEVLLRRGWYLGFDGPVTYKNAKKAPEVIALTPLDRILLETDSPYLSPVPHRGKRNDSRNLPWIAAKIAEIKGLAPEEIARAAAENGRRLFRV